MQEKLKKNCSFLEKISYEKDIAYIHVIKVINNIYEKIYFFDEKILKRKNRVILKNF